MGSRDSVENETQVSSYLTSGIPWRGNARPSITRQGLFSWLTSASHLYSARLCPLRTRHLLGKEFLQCVRDLKIRVPQARAELLFQFLHKFFKLFGTNL